MKTTFRFTTLVLCVVLAGCGAIRHEYVWTEYGINTGRRPAQGSFREGKEVKIVKGKSDGAEMLLGAIGRHKYFASGQTLTDGVADHLAKELRNQGIAVNDTAAKSLEVTVVKSDFERGAWKIAATLDVTLKAANGKVKSYNVRNSSPATVDRTYNGAIAMAVIEILNDKDVQAYVNE